MVPDQKFNNSFDVFGGNVIKCKGLSKPLQNCVGLNPKELKWAGIVMLKQ
jgi:hypothetical protein